MFSRLFYDNLEKFPESVVNDRKFSIALRPSAVIALKENLRSDDKLARNSSLLLLHHEKDVILNCGSEPTLWPKMLSRVISDSIADREYTKYKDDASHRLFALMKKNMAIQHSFLTSTTVLDTDNERRDKFDRWNTKCNSTTSLMRNLIQLETEVALLVESIGLTEHISRIPYYKDNTQELARLTKGDIRCLDIRVCWSKRVVIVSWGDQKWALPASYVLMIHNKICDTVSSLVLLQGAAGVCYEDTALQKGIDFIRLLADYASTDSSYFEVSKSLEGIVIAEVLRAEEDWRNEKLLQNIVRDLQAEGYEYEGSELQDLLRSSTTPLKHELAGLSKICGHPLIDVEETALKAQARARDPVSIDYLAIQGTRNIALQMFIKSYILQHSEWPPVTLDPLTPAYMIAARAQGKDPSAVARRMGVLSPSHNDYVFVELLSVLELNRLDHYTQYLKDRAISLLRDDVVRNYIQRRYDRESWKKTRLLLVHLFTPEDETDLTGYLRRYMKGAYSLDDVLNYLVIKLVPKEKELKMAARPFGCKTYQERYRSCMQEENSRHFLDLYSSDQAMTLDNLSLTRRLYTFRNLTKQYQDWRVLYVNFDVSGWCGNFRQETVEPIGRDLLDRLYNTDHLFSKTQAAYEQGFFYLPDESGNYHWMGQDGGIEGLEQCTWMTVYIPQMRLALRKYELNFFVMAYGDDYKAAFLIPPQQKDLDLCGLKDQIVRVTAGYAKASFGQKMKVFDSYGSEAYISFCKNASVRSSEMPQGIRKIQKCYGATNAFLPTMDDYVSSAYSNAHAAAKAMPCTYPAYRVALFWTLRHLLQHETWGQGTDNDLLAATLVPSCVGGLPVLSLSTFFTRAENDHLPPFLDLMDYLREYDRALYEVVAESINFEVDLDQVSFETILRDPYSLPVSRPPLPEGILRREILPALQTDIRNEEMLGLIEAAQDDWTDRIITTLKTCDHIPARVFSSIYACTPQALVEEIMKRFETARSIKDVILRKMGAQWTSRLFRRVVQAERRLQTWRYTRLKELSRVHRHVPGECSTKAANRLRSLWGKEVIGVTMPSLVHLITVTTSATGMLDLHCRQNHFSYRLSKSAQVVKHGDQDHWRVGDEKPFLGHKTRLGSELPKVKLVDDNPYLSKIRTLLDIISWVSYSAIAADGQLVVGNLRELVLVLLSQYYSGDPEELLPFGAQRKSGTIQHHWRSPHYSEHIMPNTLSNTYTWVTGEANTHQLMRGTSDHHTLNFLQLFCHAVHLLQGVLEYHSRQDKLGDYWGVTSPCAVCMAPIVEPPIVINENALPPPRRAALGVLTLTKQSEAALRLATGEVRARAPRPTVGLDSAEVAVHGIVQSMSDQGVDRIRRLCEALEIPMRDPTTADSLSDMVVGCEPRLVGEREIRHCDSTTLAQAVMNQISLTLLQSGSRRSALSRVTRMWLENPRSLPWTSVIYMIHKSGCLASLVNTVQRLTGAMPPVCYDNHMSAARYIGEAVAMFQETTDYPLHFVWLSSFSTDDVPRALNNLAMRLRVSIIWNFYCPLLRSLYNPRPGHPRNPHWCMAVIASMIAVAVCAERDMEDVVADLQGTGVTTEVRVLDPVSGVDEDTLELAVSDDDHLVHDVLDLISRVSPDVPIASPPWEAPEVHNTVVDSLADIPPRYTSALVTRTTLAACVNLLRSLPVSEDLAFYIERAAVPPGTLQFRKRPAPPDRSFITDGQDMPVAVSHAATPMTPVFEIRDLLLSACAVSRPYGSGTMSQNKIIEVFFYVGVRVASINNLNIMCLAEGYGGIVDLLARCGTNLHFLYNTLPPNERYPTKPFIAMEQILSGNHSLDARLVNTSVYDLTSSAVTDVIAQGDTRYYDIVTCDAEADWEAAVDYSRLLLNVARLFLVKRSAQGLLIEKVMCEYTGAVSEVIALLRQFCLHAGVLRLASSPPGGECYVVAWGVRAPYTPMEVTVSSDTARRCTRVAEQLQRLWTSMAPPADIVVTVCAPPHVRALRELDYLPAAWYTRLTGRCGILIEYPVDAKNSREIIVDVLGQLKRVHDHVTVTYHSASLTTAAHVSHYSARLILLTSLMSHFSRVARDRERTITQSQVRGAFLAALALLRPRIAPDTLVDVFTGDVNVLGYTQNLYGEWLLGLDVALQFVTWSDVYRWNKRR